MYICWLGTRRGLFQKRIVGIELNIYDLFDNYPERRVALVLIEHVYHHLKEDIITVIIELIV